jgi:hypothetical protein
MEIRTGPIGERVLVEDGRETMRTVDPAEVIGALFVAVLERTRPNLQWFALIHGAALGLSGKGLALAGPSGSGKSTLAAGLVGQGYDFLADDLIALSEPDGTIVPWPLPLSIKQGSIDIVSAHHPQLAEAVSYRTKGVEAHMLIPPGERLGRRSCAIAPSGLPTFRRRSRAARPALVRVRDDRAAADRSGMARQSRHRAADVSLPGMARPHAGLCAVVWQPR